MMENDIRRIVMLLGEYYIINGVSVMVSKWGDNYGGSEVNIIYLNGVKIIYQYEEIIIWLKWWKYINNRRK